MMEIHDIRNGEDLNAVLKQMMKEVVEALLEAELEEELGYSKSDRNANKKTTEMEKQKRQ
ncbi:MAG: hypothetical protein ACK5LT_02250 [Lachnospirales bacterium]